MSREILVCKNLKKAFTSGTSVSTVLRDISLSVHAGTLTALLGPSGSGKSTLLNILATLDVADSGSICIEGVELADMDADAAAEFRLRRIGFIFQFFNLLPTLSVLENVAIPQYLADKNAAEVEKIARDVLELVGLQDKSKRYPHELSGGEVQRVAIARSLVNKPSIVFADEPTGNLDQENGHMIMELFRSLIDKNGVSIIMATHNRAHAEIADVTYTLDRGQLVP